MNINFIRQIWNHDIPGWAVAKSAIYANLTIAEVTYLDRYFDGAQNTYKG